MSHRRRAKVQIPIIGRRKWRSENRGGFYRIFFTFLVSLPPRSEFTVTERGLRRT